MLRGLEAEGGYGQAVRCIVGHYDGEAREAMAAALSGWGLDGDSYRNACERIMDVPIHRDSDRALMLSMLFIITGAAADPYRAAREVEAFAGKRLGVGMDTMAVAAGRRREAEPAPSSLALLRLKGGYSVGGLHRLARDAAGTVVGSMPGAGSSIADVDPDVSRRHLRIWFEGGRWWCQDLGSTMGTVLVSGADRARTVVAPPRSALPAGAPRRASKPFPIDNSDEIRLGTTTRFLVMRASD